MKVLLEQRLGNKCEHKFYASQGPVNAQDTCFYQCNGYDSSCLNYKPIAITQKPYRRGSLSLKVFKN